MYQANISWQPLIRVLRSMHSQGLVREVDTREEGRRDRRTSKVYEITMKGENVIKYFKGAKDFELEDINIPV